MGGARRNPAGSALIAGLCAWGAWETRHWLHTDFQLYHWALLAIAALEGLALAVALLRLLPALIVRWIIRKPQKRTGRARWATRREVRRAGLRKRKGVLAGLHSTNPIFVNIESAGLVLSPAGGGKTVTFVVPALCHDATSMLVPDVKGTLACMTADLRRERHGHDVLYVNPAGRFADRLGISARYNPLQILVDDWNNESQRSLLLTDAREMAKKLHPDSPKQREDPYWRNGARKFLVFAFVYLVIIRGHPTLADALGLLSDSGHLQQALREAEATNHLDGDLARLATDLLTKFDEGDRRQLESFREGAVQSLEEFSHSGELAESTSHCDFRFSDLRKKKLTIYLIADPTRMSIYERWLGLLSWCALTELIRKPEKRPVVLMLDEATNLRIDNLPSMLTLTREFKIVIWVVLQELEEWVRLYGPESLQTLLSQTEVKLIMGTRSFKTCQLISNMLGQTTIKTRSHNTGRSLFDSVSASLQDAPVPLLSPDEVRRTEDSILFVRNLRPIRLAKVGYHEVRPWSKWVGINPLFGKPYKGKTRLRL